MRVLCVTSTFPRWHDDNTPTFILELAQQLAAVGVEMDVLAPHAPDSRAKEDFSGISVERFRYAWPESAQDICYQGGALFNIKGSPTTAAKLPAFVGAQWAAIRSRVRTHQYDAVSAHWLLPQGWTAVRAASRSAVPVISTVHGSDVFSLNHPLLGHFKRAALAGSAAVTVNSTATYAAVKALGAEVPNLHLIPMGANAVAAPQPSRVARWRAHRRAGSGNCRAGPLVAFAGRLIDWKGVDDLLDATALLVTELPNLSVVIAGDGPLRAHLEQRVHALGLERRVHFAGWLDADDVAALRCAADVIAVPSRTAADGSREAQGLSVVEAMALGKPVVASRAGGIPDAITDGENGLLVREADPSALAGALVRLHKDPRLGAQLGKAAAGTAQERYSWSACANRFAEVFEKAVFEKSPQHG
jgi:phosphatidylinositol alpha-1,6-mannosyltransferase